MSTAAAPPPEDPLRPAAPYTRDTGSRHEPPTADAWRPAPPKKKRSKLPLILGLLALLVILACGLAALVGANRDKDPKKAVPKASTSAQQSKANSKPASREGGPKTRVASGTWVAGKDMQPGTWRPVSDAGDSCYFQVFRKNGEADPDRLNLGAGRPVFKISGGEKVKIQFCPEFERVSK